MVTQQDMVKLFASNNGELLIKINSQVTYKQFTHYINVISTTATLRPSMKYNDNPKGVLKASGLSYDSERNFYSLKLWHDMEGEHVGWESEEIDLDVLVNLINKGILEIYSPKTPNTVQKSTNFIPWLIGGALVIGAIVLFKNKN